MKRKRYTVILRRYGADAPMVITLGAFSRADAVQRAQGKYTGTVLLRVHLTSGVFKNIPA